MNELFPEDFITTKSAQTLHTTSRGNGFVEIFFFLLNLTNHKFLHPVHS